VEEENDVFHSSAISVKGKQQAKFRKTRIEERLRKNQKKGRSNSCKNEKEKRKQENHNHAVELFK